MLKQVLLRSTGYNSWANTRIAETCSSIRRANLEKQLGGSFGSIAETLIHIHNAEYVWLRRLTSVKGSGSAIPSFDGDIDDLRARLLNQSNALNTYVLEIDPELLMKPIRYRNLAGKSFEHTPEQIIAHVVNHSTYHRGQIINYLRIEGIDTVPATDMILYMRDTS